MHLPLHDWHPIPRLQTLKVTNWAATRNPRPNLIALAQLTIKLARIQNLRQNVRYNTESLKNSNDSVETHKNKQLHSIPTHLHSVSQQEQNGFQKHLQIRFETMFRFVTMESTVEPIESNQQETSGNTQQQYPIAVTHPNLFAAITSWQNKKHHTVTKFTSAKSKSNRNLTSILEAGSDGICTRCLPNVTRWTDGVK
jgi:hypothetical protein